MPKVLNMATLPGRGMNRTLPEGAVRVDRWSPWGNPFKIGKFKCDHPDCADHVYDITREKSMAAYRKWLEGRLRVEPTFLDLLRDRDLACWCVPLPCHADIILEFLSR